MNGDGDGDGDGDGGPRTSRRAFLLAAAALAAGCRTPTNPTDTDTPVAGSGPSPTDERAATTAEDPGPAPTPVEPVVAPDVPTLGSTPFGLGVASGDPLPDRVICWCRLAPTPLAAGAGMPLDLREVDLPLVLDVFAEQPGTGSNPATPAAADLGVLVVSRLVEARATDAHSVHVDVDGLQPGRWYRYRFRYGTVSSPIGRTRTAPSPDSTPAALHVVSASCQHLEYGNFVAHRRIAEEPDLDLVLFLGDAIYEGAGVDAAAGQSGSDGIDATDDPDWRPPAPRRHDPEPTDLAGYRARYAQYWADPDLQAAHARAPWIVTWDDHEVQNNYAGLEPTDPSLRDGFAQRRAAAYRAWWEHQPVRMAPPDEQGTLPVARSFRWGGLAQFVVLDGRQHRSDQACGDGIGPSCVELGDEARSMLGTEQEAWVAEEFAEAAAAGVTWTVLANQTALTELTVRLGGAEFVMYDVWDGYPAARRRLLRAARNAGVRLVALTGDLHASLVGDLVVDGAVVGTEFLGSSIATPFARGGFAFQVAVSTVPTVRLLDVANRGYARSRIDPQQWRVDLRWVGDGSDPDADVRTASSWIVDATSPKVRRA